MSNPEEIYELKAEELDDILNKHYGFCYEALRNSKNPINEIKTTLCATHLTMNLNEDSEGEPYSYKDLLDVPEFQNNLKKILSSKKEQRK